MNPRTVEILKKVIAVISGGYVLLWIYVALSRISYPFELEWMEGAMVDSVRRVMDGLPLYVPPSIDFIPAIYTPFFIYLSAGLSAILGVGFFPLRLISFLSTLACLWLIYDFIRRETNDKCLGLIGAGLFAATFKIGGAWFDIARVDMLFLFFVLSAIYLMRFHRTVVGYAVAGVAMTLAFWTKQSAVLILIPLFVYSVWFEKRPAARFAQVVAIGIAPLALYLNSVSDGWFYYYAFDLPSQHGIWKRYILQFFNNDLAKILPVATLAAAYLLYARWKQRNNREFIYLLCVGFGLFLIAFTSRAKPGGYNNCLIPFYAGLAMSLPLALQEAFKTFPLRLQAISLLLVLLQFSMLFYNPARQIPTTADRIAGEKLMETIRRADGNVYIPFHGYYSALAGKKTYAHAMAAHDILIGNDPAKKAMITGIYDRALHDSIFSCLIVDSRELSTVGWGELDLKSHFEFQRNLMPKDSVFWPVTGMQTRPEKLMMRSQLKE